MHRVMEDTHSLHSLFERYGSPLNLLDPAPYIDNFRTYQSVLERHAVEHTIFFARKANKCRVFAKEAGREGFGVDTASYEELNQCLNLGCSPDKLVLTAAIKNEQLVRLAIENEVLMILDNTDECRLVNQLAAEMDKTPRVGIRISGFSFEGDKLYSRFGFDVDSVIAFITGQLGSGNQFDKLRFEGFHFHLDGYSIEQRGAALIQTIHLADVLKNHGISTSFIDIGGGLLTNYLAERKQWRHFWDELKRAVLGKREPITFGNNGLGYSLINGKLHGAPNVYPYYNETPKGKFLDAVLSYENEKGETVASLLSAYGIELRMEPGRSLLDQAGMTLARVVHRKQDQRGNWLVGLEMNRSQLFSSSADFLLDPVFIPLKPSTAKPNPVAVYLTGAYCLEQDIILKRKIQLPRLPGIGDVIAFPNTAGYMMHFYETRSHLHAFTTNLVVRSADSLSFTLDEEVG